MYILACLRRLKAISSVKEYHVVSKCDDSNHLLTLNPEDISNPLGNLQRTDTFPRGRNLLYQL